MGQKGVGDGPAGRKEDVTKVWYLLGIMVKDFIYDDSEPIKSANENNSNIRATYRATCKRFLVGLGHDETLCKSFYKAIYIMPYRTFIKPF